MNGETLVIIGLREFLIALGIQFVLMFSIVLFLLWRFRQMSTADRIVALVQAKDAAIATANQAAADANAKAAANDAAAQSDAAANSTLDQFGAPK